MSSQNQYSYYLNQLSNNAKNANKFAYVDSVYGNIDILNNQWHFSLNVWIISDSNMPINTYLLNINSQIFEITNICLIKKDFVKVDDFVRQKDVAQLWTCDFYVNVSNLKLSDDKLTNFKIFIDFKFLINAEALSDADITCEKMNLEKFISEVENEKLSTSILFSNYETFDSPTGSISNTYRYKINTYNPSVICSEQFAYKIHEYADMQTPIIDLLTFYTDGQVSLTSVAFECEYYDKDTVKKFSYKDEEPVTFSDEYTVQFNKFTKYSDTGDISYADNSGIYGLYLPITTELTYKITCTCVINGNVCTYVFSNKVNFIRNNDYFKRIIANHATFKALFYE